MKPLLPLVFLSIILAQPAPLPNSPVAYRTTLSAERDRDWTLVGNYDGNLQLSWTFGGKGVSPYAIHPQTEIDYDPWYHGAVDLPAGMKPGPYWIDTGGGTVQVTVRAPVKRKVSPFVAANDDSFKNFTKYVQANYTVIRLAPGEHVWDNTAYLTEGLTVEGTGATIRRTTANPMGSVCPIFYVYGNYTAVYGVEFRHDSPSNVFYYSGNPATFPVGLVVAECGFYRNNLGFYIREALVRDCHFRSAGATIAPGGIYLRCSFTGPAFDHAFNYWATLGPVAMIACTFRDTDRGPCFNALAGEVTDSLFIATVCTGINQTPNGCEIGLCEGPFGSRREVWLHTRITNCVSSFLQTNEKRSDVLCRDLFIDGGVGVLLWWGDVQRVLIREAEFRNGAGYLCGDKTRNCTLLNSSVDAWCPARGNQTFLNGSPIYGYNRKAACLGLGPNAATNTLQNVDITGLHASFTAVVGLTVVP